ncbi:MAG TPA: methyltransferase domain-containing protein [Lacipirellulaceae bacterium]|nr:methyltransferase domain-containing protein [Lacipirellulaceae bacterium]
MTTRGAHYRLFWQEFRRTFQSTGAVLPSGKRLCRKLARFAADTGVPRRLLEVGPGTGVVTDQIITRMGPGDTLDLVELNDRFVGVLQDRLARDEAWRAVRDRVRVHHMPVEQLATDSRYDAIVSGLPLNNFPADLVRTILAHLESLAAPGGTLSFFEYIGVRRVKALVVNAEERARLAGVEEALRGVRERVQIGRDYVLANVPPAWVHHLRFGA